MRDPMLQSAAVEAVVALRLKALVPDVQKVAANGEQFARFIAAAALADLGAKGGEPLLDAGLKAPATDMQLKAAGALRARGVKTWPLHVRPLLEDPNGLTRFQAAELLLDTDRPAALKVLTAGTTDPNFAIRGEVARILTADDKTPVSELRRLLRDGAPQVRVQVARAILERDVPARKK
jgi:HEAT repeat protein